MVIQIHKLYGIFFFLFFLTLNLQTLTVFGFKEASYLKVYHVIALLFFIPFLLIKDKRIPLPNKIITFFFISVFISSFFLYLFYQFNTLIVNYIFAFFTFIIGYASIKFLPIESTIKILKKVAFIITLLVLIKLLINLDIIFLFFDNPFGHPSIFTFYGGGPNLESTWLALLTALFIDEKKKYYLYFLFSLSIGIIYSSRAGVILTAVVFIFRFISPYSNSKEKLIVFLFILFISFFLLFKINWNAVSKNSYTINKFINVGNSNDKGAEGRLIMWKYFPEAFFNSYLIGYGAGNSIFSIEKISNKNFIEDNIHNYYLQILLDFGIIIFLIYLIIIYLVLKRKKQQKYGPIGIIILAYFIGSFIQFRGAEAIFWLLLGIYFSHNKDEQ